MTSPREKLPYIRAVVPGADSSPLEASAGALGWSVITAFPTWWLVSWVVAGAHDWADFFLYVVLVVATAMWTGESWYIAVRALRAKGVRGGL